jgi:hypothetical protein
VVWTIECDEPTSGGNLPRGTRMSTSAEGEKDFDLEHISIELREGEARQQVRLTKSK